MQEREEAVREEKERRNAGEASPVGCGGSVADCRLSCKMEKYRMKTYMRVEQKVHERGFLCVSLWACNEQSRLKFFFLKWGKYFFGLQFWRKFM